MHATRRLRELALPKDDGKDTVEDDPHFMDSEELIDALQSANERLTTAVKASCGTSMKSDTCTAAHSNMSGIYTDFVSEWCLSPTLEPSLVRQILDPVLESLNNHNYITETVSGGVSTSPSTGHQCITSLASHAHPFTLTRQLIAKENIKVRQEVFLFLCLSRCVACPARCGECVRRWRRQVSLGICTDHGGREPRC